MASFSSRIAVAPLNVGRGRPFLLLTTLVLVSGLVVAGGQAQEQEEPAAGQQAEFEPAEVDSIMFKDPLIQEGKFFKKFDDNLLELWLKALKQDEDDLRRQVALMVRRAHREGMSMERALPPLAKLLKLDGLHESARQEVIATLLEIAPETYVDLLREQIERGSIEASLLIEPVLARLGDAKMRDIWLKRLDDPRRDRRRVLLALEGLGVSREARAVARLQELVSDRFLAPDLRFAAATALGQSAEGDAAKAVDELAAGLAAEKSPAGLLDRLLAARIVVARDSTASQALLIELAKDTEPTVATLALRRMLERDPAAVFDLARQAVTRQDAGLRRVAAEVLGKNPTQEAIALLGARLNDAHPDVRNFARRRLVELANDERWESQIREIGSEMVEQQDWQGIEQAILLLTALQHTDAAEQFVAMLGHPRSEVYVTAAWGVRELDQSRVAQSVLDFAVARVTELRQRGEKPMDVQLGMLFEYLGRQRFEPADELLRAHIPKDVNRSESRAGAIWALGLIHEGKPDEELAAALGNRISDVFSDMPELDEVRTMAAVTLGRMGAESQLGTLRQYGPKGTIALPVEYAAAWAIEKLTGEAMPPIRDIPIESSGWLLEPLQSGSRSADEADADAE